jgi:hypothetical protein
MFRLKRPCVNCPFRKGQGELFQLPAGRLTEIFEAGAFPCHKTVDYDEDEDTGEEIHSMEQAQQCAGLMALLWREGRPNQIMRVAMRIEDLEPDDLDPDGKAYATFAEAREAHGSKGRRRA